jgi:hypothetical protein
MGTREKNDQGDDSDIRLICYCSLSMKRTLDDYFRGQAPPRTLATDAAPAPLLPKELWVHHVMPVLGAAGNDVSLRTLVRLARTCRTFYREVPWRACVTQILGFVSERIPLDVFAGFAPTLECFCYYIPCHHCAYMHLQTAAWRRCKRLTHLMLIDSDGCYSGYGDRYMELPSSVTHVTVQGPALADLIMRQPWESEITCTRLGGRTLDAFQACRLRPGFTCHFFDSICTLPGPRDLPASEEEEGDGDPG